MTLRTFFLNRFPRPIPRLFVPLSPSLLRYLSCGVSETAARRRATRNALPVLRNRKSKAFGSVAARAKVTLRSATLVRRNGASWNCETKLGGNRNGSERRLARSRAPSPPANERVIRAGSSGRLSAVFHAGPPSIGAASSGADGRARNRTFLI